MQAIISLLLIVLLVRKGAGVARDSLAFVELTEDQLFAVEDLVEKHAPLLRFHDKEGEHDFCYPEDATNYYTTRKGGDWSRMCNMNYSSILEGDVPTYWHAMPCQENLHIAYWTFTGYNHKCDGVSGERDAWWEFIVVKVRNWETGPYLAEVMFGQKKGWYTRIPGHYEVVDGTHPVAYVGRASHGFYHNAGGLNSCCYFDDLRNSDQYMRTLHTNIYVPYRLILTYPTDQYLCTLQTNTCVPYIPIFTYPID
ncbi:uncharacterized protein [Palaemon carinicauda]|uniref:uncharacterized protein isoform X2 n=1 Tax=Palaemon carinicauda TaxID=392227 RepID=UPI0035B62CED